MKKIVLLLTLLPALLSAKVYTFSFCGFYYDPGVRDILLLDQTLISDPSLYPFLNCKDARFCEPFGNASDVDSYDNLEEWERYFNQALTKDDIRKGFYHPTFLDFDKFLRDYTSKNYQPKTELERYILKASNKEELLHYFWFAKKCELIYKEKYELERSWYQGESIATTTEDIQKMYQEAIDLYSKTQDAFLKNRIGFQIVRLAFELGMPEKTNELFETYMKYDERSKYIYYKAMERNATMLYKSGNKVESLRQFRQVFENLQDRKDDVFLSLLRLPMRDLDLSNHSQENELLHFLYGFYGNSVIELEEILKINPNSSYAEVLAMRYFDSLHEIYFGGSLDSEEEEVFIENIANVAAIVDNQLNNSTVKNKELWSIFKGITEIVKGEYEAATQTFTKTYNNTAYRNQAEIFVYAIKVVQLKDLDIYAMDRLFLELKGTKNLYGNHGVRGFYFQKMAQLYAENGQKIIAAFLDYQPEHYATVKVAEGDELASNFYASDFLYEMHKYLEENELLAVKALITATSKTELEHLIVSMFPDDKDDFINEMLGTYYLRENDLEQAISYFNQVKDPESYYQEGIRNSLFSIAISEYFNVSFLEQSDRFHKDYPDIFTTPEINKEYYKDNKLLLAKTLQRLENLAQEDAVNAGAYYYMLGNAWYNLSELGWFVNTLHYLNSGNDTRYAIVGDDDFGSEDGIRDSSMLERALNYYVKAYEFTSDEEIKAKAAFGKAKSEMCYDSSWNDSAGQRIVTDFCQEHAIGFEQLQELENTKFYQEVINECTYFKAYLQGN
ncbi:MAG: hypothetical protein AAF611_03730 [Bacteroidota bacterium]